MQKKTLLYNSISPLIFQITTVLCGFILPKLILSHFGSNINGLVNSISQFLGVIAFLELGIGAVIQSSLYKPLAESNNLAISKVITSADKFFRKIGYILIIYVGVTIFFYPIYVNQQFSFFFTVSLILVISIRFFAQYFFGIVNRLLLIADQKGYIQYNAQTLAVIGNTVACYVLIKLNCSIQTVYGMTSFIFLLQPFLIHLYIKKKYTLNRNIEYKVEPIKQKWNGIAQHVAAFVLDGTDIIVLSFFSTLTDVSIYSVYILVIKGVKQLFLSIISGIHAVMGNLWAKQEMNELGRVFIWTEWIIHSLVVLVFSITSVLIVPFIDVFTNGVSDADYFQPTFAILIVLANTVYCLSLPYLIMILAAGHYKETQNKFIICACINLVASIFFVKCLGLSGVALGTLLAMIYQLIWMIRYNYKNLIDLPVNICYKQVVVDIILYVSVFIVGSQFFLYDRSYYAWIILAMKVSISALIIVLIFNIFLYEKNIQTISSKLRITFKTKKTL